MVKLIKGVGTMGNKSRRKYYAQQIISTLKTGKIPDGKTVGVVAETSEKCEDIIQQVIAGYPEAKTRWSFIKSTVGGNESKDH
jgi:hypothetical protein